jgi:uncharacterized LabA/DUF88 family protein
LPHQDRLNIAVFIDFDNIEIGVKSTLNEHFDVGTILDAIKERGEVVTKIAYADWTRAGEYSRTLTQHAIRLVQRNLTPGGDKNGADINLALDALEMAFTHPHINAYVIVGGDSDFLSLVEKLKQYDKKVFVVGGRAFTSVILQRNCHEFIAYENLVRKPSVARGGRPAPAAAASPIAQAFPIVRRALKILADREVSPQTGLLKSTLLQLDSTFSERNYGASSFLDFVEKLAKAGLVQLKHAGRSVMVELNDGFDDEGQESIVNRQAGADADLKVRAAEPGDVVVQPVRPAERPTPQTPESAAEGVRMAADILRRAVHARWPMYLRNVKQILRQADAGFDERRFGFGGLMDLVRALQREGVVRVERDRRGGLRVFQGSAFQRPPAAEHAAPELPTERTIDVDQAVAGEATAAAPMVEVQPGEALHAQEAAQPEEPEAEPIPVDTTAELLGRAKPKRRTTAGRSARKPAARKPARRAARSKKSPAAEAADEQ